MRLGLVTTNFPPSRGGMQEHARGLVTCLARDHHVTAFVRRGAQLPAPLPNTVVTDQMTWHRELDLPILRRAEIDAWLVLDAGLADYLLHLQQPGFAYVHGNDFLRPWYPREDLLRRGQSWLMRRLGLPGAEASVMAWRRKRVRAGLHRALAVFANSNWSRAECGRLYGLPPARLHVVPPGIAPEFYQERARPPSPELRLLTVARLHAHFQRKNVDGVLRALAAIGPAFPWRYTVIGNGSDRERLQALAAELGIADWVSFTGEADQAGLLDAYATHDVFIMPVRSSPTDQEGFGMVFAEAAASGLPSIATGSGGIPDVVIPGVSGVLIEGDGPEHIAAAITRFRAERDSYEPQAIRRFAERFSARACTSLLMQTVQERLAAAPIGRRA
jgi:phosphatidylinositol alpha-1,6-mannosyltransferase